MVIDGSNSLKAAAKIVYPNMPTLLYTWHINKYVLANCKGNFLTKEEWEAFYIAWQCLIQLPTPNIFKERWVQFVTNYDYRRTKSYINYIKKE